VDITCKGKEDKERYFIKHTTDKHNNIQSDAEFI
jgi:hypothetical protein